MKMRKKFKFSGDLTVKTGEGDSRAEKRESSLPEAKIKLERTDGHSFARPGFNTPEELLFDGCSGGISSYRQPRTGLHR